jgi:hypothetical protein
METLLQQVALRAAANRAALARRQQSVKTVTTAVAKLTAKP